MACRTTRLLLSWLLDEALLAWRLKYLLLGLEPAATLRIALFMLLAPPRSIVPNRLVERTRKSGIGMVRVQVLFEIEVANWIITAQNGQSSQEVA